MRTDTLQQRVVVHVSTGAVAVVSGDVVDTHAVLTNLWMEALTLVHIWSSHGQILQVISGKGLPWLPTTTHKCPEF